MDFFSKFFYKNNKKRDFITSIDITSGTIEAITFYVDKKEEKSYIVGFGKEKQKLAFTTRGIARENFLENFTSSCSAAIKKSLKMAGLNKTQSKILIGVGGNFSKCISTKISYRRDNPKTKIELNELKDIICKLKLDLFDVARRKTFSKKSIFDKNVKIVDVWIVDVFIDGYRVINPIDFKGGNLEFAVFMLCLPIKFFEVFLNLSNKLQVDLFGIVSKPYAVSVSIGAKDNIGFKAIIIDVENSLTQVSIVQKCTIEDSKTFNIGSDSFTQELSKELGISADESEKMILKYYSNDKNDKIDEKLSSVIKRVIEKNRSIWLSGVELAIKDSLPNLSTSLIPKKVLLYGKNDQLKQIGMSLKKLAETKNVSFPEEISISFLDARDILYVGDKTEKLGDYKNISLLGMAGFASGAILTEDLPSRILRNSFGLYCPR